MGLETMISAQHLRWRLIMPRSKHTDPHPTTPTPAQSALYTYDMLVSLKKLAAIHRQMELAQAIEAAALEAESLMGKESA